MILGDDDRDVRPQGLVSRSVDFFVVQKIVQDRDGLEVQQTAQVLEGAGGGSNRGLYVPAGDLQRTFQYSPFGIRG